MYTEFNYKVQDLNNNQDIRALNYLKDRLSNLDIEILDQKKQPIFNLVNEKKLMGWCWQTTESAILFLNDDDYIQRGVLDLDKYDHGYYHSWICFKYNDKEMIFDPCFNILCNKEDYLRMFFANVYANVYAKDVKETFIKSVQNHKYVEEKNTILKMMLREKYQEYIKRKAQEVIIKAKEDVNEPFYRSGAGYFADIENENIRRLTVHYYYTDC